MKLQTSNFASNYFDDRSDFLTEQGQETPDAGYLDTSRPARMAEAYCKGCLILVFHVKQRRVNGERHDFSAIYNVVGIGSGRLNDMPEGIFDVSLSALLPRDNYVQQSVLVTIIEVSDKREQRGKQFVHSMVRLYPLNVCPHCAAQRPDSPFLLMEAIRAVGDGELEFPFVAGKDGRGLMDGNGIDKMIERTSKIVDTISSDQRPPVPIRDCEINGNIIAAPLRVTIFGEAVRLRIFPNQNLINDGFGVFLCTTDLQPTIG